MNQKGTYTTDLYNNSALLVLNGTSLNRQTNIQKRVNVDPLWFNLEGYIIQILTGTVMKYHVSGGTVKRVIFSQGIIFSRSACSTEGNIVPGEKYNYLGTTDTDISSVPVDICYIIWSKWMISSKVMCSKITTKFGNKTRSLRTKQNGTQTWQLARPFYYDVLLLTTAYSAYAVHFFLGQFPNMELMLLLSPLFYLLNCYISRLRHFGCYNSEFYQLSMRLTTWAS